MPALSKARKSIELANSGIRVMNSQNAAPATRPIGAGLPPSKIRAPVQVTANEVSRIALARSMVKTSGSCPYMPNIVIEPARSRCAAPHHATAWISEFCTQANSSSKPRMAST